MIEHPISLKAFKRKKKTHRMDEYSGIYDIEDIMVSVFDIVEEYESGQISRDRALKRALKVIEGLKSVDESMYQEIKNDLITIIFGKSIL